MKIFFLLLVRGSTQGKLLSARLVLFGGAFILEREEPLLIDSVTLKSLLRGFFFACNAFVCAVHLVLHIQ